MDPEERRRLDELEREQFQEALRIEREERATHVELDIRSLEGTAADARLAAAQGGAAGAALSPPAAPSWLAWRDGAVTMLRQFPFVNAELVDPAVRAAWEARILAVDGERPGERARLRALREEIGAYALARVRPGPGEVFTRSALQELGRELEILESRVAQ